MGSAANKTRKRENSSRRMVFGVFDTSEDYWFVVMQVLTHLGGSSSAKKLVNVGVEVLFLMAWKALMTLSVKMANSGFIREEFVMYETGRWNRGLVDLVGMSFPKMHLFLP